MLGQVEALHLLDIVCLLHWKTQAHRAEWALLFISWMTKRSNPSSLASVKFPYKKRSELLVGANASMNFPFLHLQNWFSEQKAPCLLIWALITLFTMYLFSCCCLFLKWKGSFYVPNNWNGKHFKNHLKILTHINI